MKRFFLFFVLATLLISATTELIELEKKSILDEKVEILLPKDFTIMDEQTLSLKYPSERRPTLVYTDKTASVNIAFNHTTNKASQTQIEAYKESFISTFKKILPTAKWKGSGVKQINGRKVGFLELETEAADSQIYNLMFFTNLEGRLLLCTFNCTIKKQDDWFDSAQKIMNSLVIK